MKRLFFTVGLLLGISMHAAAAEFDESRVVKRKDTTAWTRHGSSPEIQKTPFEAMVLDDHSLWMRPKLVGNDAKMRFGHFAVDRNKAVQFPLAGYKAHELFAFDNQLFVTVSDTVDPERRYIMVLKPDLSRPTTLGQMIWASVPIFNLSMAYWAFTGIKTFPTACTLLTGVFLFSAVQKCMEDVGAELAKAKVKTFEPQALDNETSRLRVIKYVFGPKAVVEDVLLADNSGKMHSLREISGYVRCSDALKPYLAGN